MKRVTLFALALLLSSIGPEPVMAQTELPLTIGGGSIGYGVAEQDRGQNFTGYWGGIRAKTVTSQTAFYALYQHVGIDGGNSGDGAKLMLMSGDSTKIPDFYLLADVGVAWDLAQNADGTTTEGLTAGLGLAYQMTEYLSPFVYVQTYDSGPRFTWAVHFGFAAINLEKIIPSAK